MGLAPMTSSAMEHRASVQEHRISAEEHSISAREHPASIREHDVTVSSKQQQQPHADDISDVSLLQGLSAEQTEAIEAELHKSCGQACVAEWHKMESAHAGENVGVAIQM